MTRAQLEHVIRAACSIADDDELIIVGSQSILGQFPNAPPELLVSMEVDLWPRHHRERAALIEGSIGELSMFHETFGYYADGLVDITPTLPDGWEDRLIAVRGPGTDWKTGLTLEVHDLVISKYVAGRPRDRQFNRSAIRHGMADPSTLRQRLARTPIDPARAARIEAAIAADAESDAGTPAADTTITPGSPGPSGGQQSPDARS